MNRFWFFFNAGFTLMGLNLIAVILIKMAPALIANENPSIPQWVVWTVTAITAMYLTFTVHYLKKEWK